MRPSIYRILAAILHLSNISFTSNCEGFAKINETDDSFQSIQYAANLLKINSYDLERVLLERTIAIKDVVSYVKCKEMQSELYFFISTISIISIVFFFFQNTL